MTKNKFVFVSPMYNASKTLARMLHSIAVQSYYNWEIILIDDVSDKLQYDICVDIIDKFNNLVDNKIKLLSNNTKRWETYNVLKGIKLCNDNDVICRIDADDALCDIDVLSMINFAYNNHQVDALWTKHRWTSDGKNISGPMPREVNPYKYIWVSSHLKTFRKHLINNIPFENFTNQNGDCVRRCGDQAIYLPVLHNAAQRRLFLPTVCYSYTIDEQNGEVYQTEDAKFQKQEAEHIRKRGYVSNGLSWENVVL